jgi:hypothetical protein
VEAQQLIFFTMYPIQNSNALANSNRDMLMVRTNGRNIEVAATGQVAQFLGVVTGLCLLALVLKTVSN